MKRVSQKVNDMKTPYSQAQLLADASNLSTLDAESRRSEICCQRELNRTALFQKNTISINKDAYDF